MSEVRKKPRKRSRSSETVLLAPEEALNLTQAKGRIEEWLRRAVEQKVSDIHLVEGLPPMFRLHGALQGIEGTSMLSSPEIEAIARVICTDKQWREYGELGEVDLAYELKDISRFRVNVFRQMDTVAIALRQIPIDIPNLSSLGMPEVLRSMIQKNQGLFLVTGPTGSGKSTTLAAMLDYLNETKKTHILTLEDPVEYLHKHKKSIISQREIGRDTESFANGLRAALRQDPDVILVGEMRDFDTISIALTAAETGHLVLGTLHTSSAPSTIERIVDVFPAEQQSQVRTQLAGALIGILSQRLLPTMDGDGRVAATEMLVNSKGIASIIRSGKTHQITNMLLMGKAEGMHTMSTSVTQLSQAGRVDADVASGILDDGGGA
ncbi:type IV pilus twitching motility protein PilT [uncultured Vagococcus sp.]|uniref:type IV pilus twitching motility protein PilT n=1 Tax=uncultured Vagococcus sp. TaxID=189676 RepID=UPI0028D31D09|nr:type IV pilus twitching motility protein PilT [uncultured Vagococcus sp.]